MFIKRNQLALALMGAGLCFTGIATAAPQDADQSASTTQDQNAAAARRQDEQKKARQLGTVEVSGFVSSLQNSTALKRNSDAIVEAVSAEQIGKLPGVSIADTLGRLPGLAVQTVSGRPQVVSIHGLGPDFSTALVNGSQQVSTSNNRDVQYDQYPSSWFDSVVVHLSPTANLVGQGLSGTVDMRTIRPLDKDKPESALNARYIWDSTKQLADGPGVGDRGYDVNGVWVNQFANHTFGVTVGIDFQSNPSQIQHQGPWGYPTDGNGDLVVGGSKNYGISDQMNRSGLLTTLQWQPNEHFTSTLDLTYDKFKESQAAKGIEFPLFWSAAQLQPGGNVQNGFVQSGTYDNVKAVVRNDYNKTNAKVYNVNWENTLRFNENWSATLTASYSRAQRHDLMLESYSGTGYAADGATDSLQFSEMPNGMLWLNPSLDYSGSQMVLTDPQGWGGGATPPVVQAGFINAPHTDDHLANLRLAVEREFLNGPFSSMEFGVVRGTRNKTYNIDQSFLILPGGAQTAALNASSCSPLAWMGIGSQVCYNPQDLIANGTYELFPTALSSISVPPNWKVNERDLTSYLQFNLDTSLGDVGLRGNFGVQAAHTAQSSAGQRVEASAGGTNGSNVALVPVSGGTSFTKYLPSMNLIFGFGEQDDLRVGAARVMARPRMDQMSASLGVSGNITRLPNTDPNQSYFSADGGNAKLLPTMADNYNVSYEHYFENSGSGYECSAAEAKTSDLCRSGGAGYVSVAAYFLGLKDYINPSAAFLYDFAPFVGAYLSPAQQQQLGTTMGIVSGPTNDGRGYVKGLQTTLNLPFSQISPALSGFGGILTGGYTKSSLVYGDAAAITVPGLSKWTANATLYYQHNGFEARIGDSYRSSFLGEVSGISATRIQQTIKGGSVYDAQVSYTFNHGPLEGLTLIAQGSNLSNKTFVTYQNDDPRQVLTWERYGRRYEVGVSYKFQ